MIDYLKIFGLITEIWSWLRWLLGGVTIVTLIPYLQPFFFHPKITIEFRKGETRQFNRGISHKNPKDKPMLVGTQISNMEYFFYFTIVLRNISKHTAFYPELKLEGTSLQITDKLNRESPIQQSDVIELKSVLHFYAELNSTQCTATFN